MGQFQALDVTYLKWKEMRTFLGGTANSYYVQLPDGYMIVLVDLGKNFVVSSRLHTGNIERQANVADFESNIKSLAIAQNSIDDCVASAIIGA